MWVLLPLPEQLSVRTEVAVKLEAGFNEAPCFIDRSHDFCSVTYFFCDELPPITLER
jgi:hypothetical protein